MKTLQTNKKPIEMLSSIIGIWLTGLVGNALGWDQIDIDTIIQSATQGQGKPNGLSEKANCPFGSGGYHIISNLTLSAGIADACASSGWIPAEIREETEPFAAQTMAECQTIYAWVGAYDGLNANPCMLYAAYNQERLLIAEYGDVCLFLALPVLCQDPIVIPASTSTTVTVTTAQGTLHITTTTTTNYAITTVTKGHCDRRSRPGKYQLPYALVDGCRDCSIVCPAVANGIRVIRRLVPYGRAQSECERYGWKWLDYTSGQQGDLAYLFQQCNVNSVLLVRSFNGVAGGAVLFLSRVSLALRQTLALGAYFGERAWGFSGYPVCMEQPNAATGYGPWQQATVTSTSTITSTRTTTTPAVTDTLTSITVSTITVTVHRDNIREPSEWDSEDCHWKPDWSQEFF